MAAIETKSTHSQQHQTARNSSPEQMSDRAFFSEQVSETTPFFQSGSVPVIQTKIDRGREPFFQPDRAPEIQAKCAACSAADGGEIRPKLQRMPAFESDAEFPIQAKPAFESEEVASVQTRSVADDRPEIESEESPEEAGPVALQTKTVGVASDAGGADSPPSNPSLPFFQPKLTIGKAGDRYEREADAIADRIASQPGEKGVAPTSASPELRRAIQRLETVVQTAENRSKTISPPANFESRLQSARGGGAPLDDRTRSDMESGFGADFGGVRVHTDSESASLNQSMRSLAFTHGNDIFFNSGEYRPQTRGGKHLLAHELTHTLQQGASIQQKPEISATGHDVQAYLPDFITDELNDYAQQIPGYKLMTVAIGFNPLTGNDVERNAMNWIEGLMKLVPFGAAIYNQLKEYQILQDAFKWIEGELDRLDLSINRIENTIEAAWDEIELIEGFDYNLRILERHFDRLYEDVKAFALSLVDKLIELIEEAAIDFLETLLANNQAWELLKKIFRYDPLRGEEVNASTAEILEDFLLLIGKEQELEKMKEEGTLQRTADWLDTQIPIFNALLGQLLSLFISAIDAIRPENLPDLATNLKSLSTQVDSFLEQVWEFASTVAKTVLEFIKDALLGALKSYASDETPGYPLLTVILGKDPFTQERVPRTPTNLIKGFMSLMPGGIAQFNQLQETGVIPKAADRIEKMVGELGITWPFIQELFLSIWDSLTIEALLTPIDTFIHILNQFREPLNRLFAFVIEVIKVVLELVLELMNFPSDILANIINNAMQAFDQIRRDPVGFLLNMLEAVKLGFGNFFDNILEHLGTGLQEWFFAQLGKAGIQPPPDLSLASILDLVLQILGVGMDQIWSKLADRIGQENVDRIRGAIDRLTGIWNFVSDVQERGIGAIWEYIESQIGNLWNMVLEQAKEWILTRVIDRVITKLITMLDPSGIMAVVNSFIAFFNAIESAIEYFRELLEIVNDWASTIASIASGDVEPGAEKMEQGLANSIPVAIGFLANQVELGNLGEKIAEIITEIRGLIDQALDWLMERVVSAGQALLQSLGAGGEAGEEESADMENVDPEVASQITAGLAAIPQKEAQFLTAGKLSREEAEQVADAIKREHPVFKVFEVIDGGDSWDYHYEVNPNSNVAGAPKDEKCSSPGKSADDIGRIRKHGSQEPIREAKQKHPIQYTRSEHIIPFATARNLRTVVSLPGKRRSDLSKFDNSMFTLIIYKKAGEEKNKQDEIIRKSFEKDFDEAGVKEKIRRGITLYEGGNMDDGEKLVKEAVASISSGLRLVLEEAAQRTTELIGAEWEYVEPGCEQSNGKRRGEKKFTPDQSKVEEAATDQYDGLFELVKQELEAIQAQAEMPSFEGRSIHESGILDELEQAGYRYPQWNRSTESWIISVPNNSYLPPLYVDSNEIIHYK